MSFSTEDSGHLSKLLDREELPENQIRFLVVDVLVGDVPLDYWLKLKAEASTDRVSKNAQRIIDYINRVRQ